MNLVGKWPSAQINEFTETYDEHGRGIGVARSGTPFVLVIARCTDDSAEHATIQSKAMSEMIELANWAIENGATHTPQWRNNQ